MSNRKSDQKLLTIIFSQPLIMILVLLLSILAILSLRESDRKANLVKENLVNNQKNVAKLRDEVKNKKELLISSQNDLYKEKIQRNELLQQRPGEMVLQVALPNKESQTSDQQKTISRQEQWQSNWQAWWKLIAD